MLTERIKSELVANEPLLRHRANEITVIPCCVNTSRFSVANKARAAYRQERGWTDRRVLVYTGKLGTWYLADEMARFFAAARQRDARFFFQVLTQDDSTLIKQALEMAGVSEDDFDIRFAPPEQLPLLLMAADASISFRKGEYSKLAASPTKVGESLAAGLPVVTNAGIGDCDQMLKNHGLGVILSDFSEAEYRRAAGELCALIEDENTSHRCREYAGQELSLSRVGGPRYAAMYERLLDAPSLAIASQAAEPV
jgi:glycosyltransferase involved in cell wall biosynthesis